MTGHFARHSRAAIGYYLSLGGGFLERINNAKDKPTTDLETGRTGSQC
jgi:hypothetical protein